MNGTKIFFQVFLVLLLTGAGWPGHAAPRYTDRENALNLAEALDKGIFQNQLITSTFIQSTGKGRYFIKVILDNGAEENWDLNQLNAFSRGQSLVLQNNRALVFPDGDTNRFVILDKNRFTREALAATVYIKEFGPSDVLVGQKINFGVHRFNLVNLLNTRPDTDEIGYPRHYILDLQNGQREVLSYREAQRVLDGGGLIADPTTVSPVLRAPYRLRALQRHPLQAGNGGPELFAVEMVFDRPVQLEPGHFPFRVFERPPGQRRGSNFVVEIAAPNAILAGKVPGIRTLEFLHDVRVVPDPSHPVRVLLRANLSPDVMNFPPQITVAGASVFVSFAKVVDQTVLDQRALLEADLRARQERLLSRTLTTEEIEERRTYRARMGEGDSRSDDARRAQAFAERLQFYHAAVENYRTAAAYAASDRELQEAIRARNELLVRIPLAVVEYVSTELEKDLSPDARSFRGWLEDAAVMTRDPALRTTIRRMLKNPKIG